MAKHLIEGDKNTKYFHALVKKNIIQNYMCKITLANGTMHDTKELIFSSSVEHFKNLLNNKFIPQPISQPRIIPNMITKGDNPLLL